MYDDRKGFYAPVAVHGEAMDPQAYVGAPTGQPVLYGQQVAQPIMAAPSMAPAYHMQHTSENSERIDYREEHQKITMGKKTWKGRICWEIVMVSLNWLIIFLYIIIFVLSQHLD